MSITDRIASLTPEQRALFERLREKQRQAARTVKPPPIPRVSGPTAEGDWPLSLDQERYWFMEQLYPGEAGLNITAATRMRGPLPPAIVAAALSEIVRRHAAWRTVFPVVDGRPVQRVVAARPQALPVIDLGGLPAARREPEALRLVGEDTAAPFDLERGPLLRSTLVRLSAGDHVCLLTVHHLVTDWISFQIAWAELAALFDAVAAGGVPALPEPPVQYPDFALWQRGWLQGEVLAELTSWWREQLAGFPTALDLPVDRPRPAELRMRGGRLPFVTSRELADGLRSLARQEGATLFMLVLAATAALLHRDSGQERLILGANNANRNRPEIEPVLGCFLTQVPFPLDLTGDPSFRELLARVRRSALGAYAHQDLPFGQLVQALQLERDPSRQPLIQTLVQVLEGSTATHAGATSEAVDAWDGRARYDLMLTLYDYPGGLVGALEYDADLFDAATTARRVERLLLQAAAAVADPDLPLSALPVLPAMARHQIAIEWNDTARPRPVWTAPERFAEQAARTPAALAVTAAGEGLSYAALDRRSDALAHRLRTLGVGPGSRVALLLERTLDIPVAILGVWKAGGAYVPLDPDSPADRLVDLLADAEPAVVVHRGGLPVPLAEGMRPLDLAAPEPDAEAGTALPGVRPEHLAYLIYTSGTTGRPKAVMIEHGNLAAVLASVIARFSLGPGDRVPQLARYTFDAKFLDLVAPLLAGGSVEVLGNDEVLDPERLLPAIERSTVLFTVPALLRRAVPGARVRGPERFAGLRAIGIGADVVTPELQAELLAAFPSAELDVLYGPTEATILCAVHRVLRSRRPERVLIGRPLPEVELRVVDPRGRDVPLGIPGELWIGGPGVARGYFRREQLTAERFVVADGRRFYRTGDLVRQVPAEGGALEFLGRTDLQVKVRGFRIEPGEVEAALLVHPTVRDAVVVAHAGTGGENQLVAYVVAAAGVAPVEEIRAFLRTLLPDYMVPAIFVPLAALPLNPSGKVDRKALPAPEAVRESLAGSTPPRDAREELLAGIWRGVLALERVGVHDNFFQLGGDSILSIQVVARARQAGLLITPRQLFENQTIAGLAAVARSAESAPGSGADQGPVEGEALLTPIQRRFFEEARREPWRFNQAVLLAPRERFATAPLATALARLAEHHDALRLRFPCKGGEQRQLHTPAAQSGKSAPLLEIDLEALPPGTGTPALEAAAEQLQSGLDLARGPVFTAALFRREGEGDRLLLTAHHLVVDGVSWRVLLEDLTAAYRQLAAGAAPELPAKTTSWKRWAELLAGHARSPELLAELPYWLASRESVPPLPCDLAGEPGRATVSVELSPEETRALLQEVPEVYRTQVNDLLLAALARAFAAWTGESTLRVDLEGHGREEIFPSVDLSRTVGWFTTLFPVTLALPPGAGPREAIQGGKEWLRSVPRRGLGYGLLRHLAGAETGERLAALPAPQVSFNYLGRFDPAVGEGGLFAFAAEGVRSAEGEPVPGRPLFAIDALVLDDRLRVTWTYDPGRHLPATAERLARGFLDEIAALVAHCRSPEAGGFTPSDFPLAGLDQAALDRLLGNDPGVEDLYPLAPLQQGILFHSLYTAGADLYVEQFTAELAGPLDGPAFAAAWQRVVERHPALRTAFLWQEVEPPLQLVRRTAELPWTFDDWRGLPPAILDLRWRDLLAADRARGFELGRPPLLRLAVVRTDEKSHRLIWSSHHLIFDGWCFSLLLTEVFALYQAAVSGRKASLTPAPRPFRDYIAWLAERDEGEAERYWRQRLHGFATSTPVPFDLPAVLGGGDGSRADDYRERTVSLPAPLAAALAALAQRLQVTLNTLVQGAWALLLSRYAQVSDVVFGAVVSGRPAELPGVESMVGLFINTLPVRVEIPEGEGAAAWLPRLQASQFELRQYEWLPLARVQALAELSPGEPLFASLLAFENYPVSPEVSERLGELRITEAAVSERTNYPLTLTVVARGELSFRLTADRRFEPATVRRMLAHLANLLDALAAAPGRPPRALPLLAAAERHQLTVEWNDTATPYPAAASIPELFAEQAALRPDALALLGPDPRSAMTYRELDERSAALARELARQGIGRGDLVGLFAERSAELVIAILGILRAGAAYVPLDPSHPRERLALMLADIVTPLVLVQPDLAGRLPAGVARTLPLVPGAFTTGADAPSGVTADVTAADLAYVLYTSGSTGTPKGVAVSHRSVVRLVRDTGYAAFGPDEVFLMMAPVSFDASTFELWGPLLNGGSLAILPSGEVALAGLERAIRDSGVTTLWLTAGLFHLVVDERPAALAPLRQLLAGGDVLSPPHVARLRRELPGLRLVNGYGPTENTTFTSCQEVDDGDGAAVPIGRPIANTVALVIDRDLEPAPIGVPGELHAGGAGLAQGYLGRPGLTAAAFVPAPFGAPGERLYRTGDLVRRLPDGRLDFLGRVDRQVKVRGFRIELGEIEAVLAGHRLVREAAVVAPRDGGRERRLVAYAVPRGERPAPLDTEEVLAHLAERLPVYMVPAGLVWLDALPLSPTGKVDRAALLALAAERTETEDFTPPRTEIEETLAAIWRQVLGCERVGVHDSFFRLGGDSILSIQVVARARQAGLVVTPRQIFEEQTIAALAAAATPLAAADSEQGAVEGDVPLTPIQRYFFAMRPAEPHHFNQSLLLLLREPLALPALARAVAALMAHHDALRLRFVEADDGWRSWNAPREERTPFATLDLSALPLARRPGALEDSAAALQAGFDLARGPLFRAVRFVPGGDEPERLLLVAHHLVVDGVSWRILLDDLETAYTRAAAGLTPGLPAKTTAWKRWAERLAEYARSTETQGELPSWLSAPADTEPLPHDGERSGGIGSVSAWLGRDVTRSLLGEAPAAYNTQVNDLLLAALVQAFARWTAPATGELRLRFDLEGHGREEIEPGIDLSRTVGWFTTIFPVVLEAAPDAGPGELIRAVKEKLRAIPRRGLGYGLLRYLGEGQEAARLVTMPDPEVAFNYLGQLDAALGTSARWGLAPESAGPDQSRRARPRHSIEVNAWVLDGELRVSWTYDAARHAPGTIERLARDYVAVLAALVAHCTARDAGGRTPSDFPLARLDQRTLDTLVGTGATLDLTIEDLYPLAPLQEGMLFQGLYAPDSELYFEHLTAEFVGPLDAGAFARAWQAVVDRHPVLRTAFAWEGLERPLQIVRRGVELPWMEEDWRRVPREEVPERLAAWLAADRAQPFDLARPPLTRAALLRTGEDRYRFIWSFHHLLIDGWCFSLIFREVFAFYQAALAGREAHLSSIRPYRDFIAWVARQDASAAETYFRRALAGFTEPTRLPLDRPGLPAGEDGGPRDQELRLSTARVAELTALAQSRDLTLNTLVQGAWALTLARYGGEPDVVFGSVVSGRPAELPGVESMIGLFINTLPVRLVADPAAPLAPWLAGVQERLLAIRQHETASLAQIQRASEVPPGEPLFHSLVAFENYPVDESLGEGADELAVTEVTVSDRTDYPLSLAVLPGRRAQGELSLRLAHDRRTDATTARRLLAHLERLLGAFAAAPERPLGDLPAFSAAERHQLVLEWNDTAPEAEADLCLHDLVSVQARRLPAAVALAGGGREITYGELDRRANQLAHHLRALGVGPEARVALMVERSLEMVVAVIGILKAGGAYVPIDPATPADRLAFLLADARPALLLTETGLADRLPEDLRRAGSVVPVVALDAAREHIDAGSGEPPAVAVDPENLAYVIYTSGSTGTPKGVAVRHRSVVAYVRAAAREFGLGPGDRELQFSSLSFDASVEEIFVPLATGAAVVPRTGPAEEPARFFAECAKEGITALSLPTAYWHQIAAALEAGDLRLPPGLRLIVVGGERALPERWASWGKGPGRRVRLINAYGPTEATVSPTHHEHPGTPDPLAGRQEVPIGRPLPGLRAHVVDRDLQPVPVGGTGELVVGGSGPARGYLARPALTAEKFVPDPFAGLFGEPGARLYRTGDLARFRADGTLEFAGRLDAQVKVRGFRVEPGEIEAALAVHPGLREAAVVPHRGGDSLLACVVPVDAVNPPGAAELRAFLAERLPAHLIPGAYAVLPELPLTSSGKVDRRALERLEIARPAGAGTPPGTPAERAMAELWRQVLGVAEVRLEDDFFALGGHSLLATQLASRVRAAFGVDLPIRRLFEHPLLGDLTAAVVAEPGAASALPQIPRRPSGLEPIPASFAQERLWFLDRLQPGNPAYNMPDTLHVRGELSPAFLAAVLGEIVRRHEALRTTFQEHAGQPVQVIAPPRRWELPLVDLAGLPETVRLPEARRLAREDAVRPFDLARGPLLRALLLRLAAADHALLLNVHHIVSDGWSLGVLVREITALYGAARAGVPSPLPELPIQYADFAVWQRGWLTGEELERQLSYWRQRLAGAPPAIDLPFDRPRPAVPTYRGAYAATLVDAEVAAELSRLARRHEATLFMVILAAFQALLRRLTGQEDLAMGSPIANRNRAEIEPLIGFFVNMLVLRGDLAGDPAFRELLARVRRTTLEAYGHQDLPFERLVEELRPERRLAVNPLFQVICALQNAPVGAMELPGLSLSPFEAEISTTRFDLELYAWERGGPLATTLVYSADLFDAPTVRRLSGYLEVLLRGIAADPSRRISELPLLREGELHQLLREWNPEPVVTDPGRVCLHRLFEAQVDRAPAATAVSAGEERLTYGELDRQANRLARHLQAAGVRPGDRVALCLERSPEMIVAILAVLKAGAAYVPLDPAYPAERLAFTLADSGASLLVAEGDLTDSLPTVSVPMVRLDAEREAIASRSGERLATPGDPDLPAYVIYTSGSTGRPKGVLVSHGNVDRLFTATTPWFGFGADDVWALFHSYAFDFSVWEIWGALLHGGRLVVVSFWESRSPEDFYRLLREERVTVLNQTPSAFRQLLWAEEAVLGAAAPDLALRWVIFGGEALEPASLAPWFARHGDVRPRLINMYGITETTVHVTYRPLREADRAGGSMIGQPIPDLAVYLLDPYLRPVPTGVPGEVYVGGAGLAQGYLGRPELTAERFVPDPFSGQTGARLYRSGDLARRQPDGDLGYLGRLDHQVKLRGFRIELGEIESALLRHPQVREAVVTLREEAEGAVGSRLVAYVVPREVEPAVAGDTAGHVTQWQTLYDETYGRGLSPESGEDQTFNIRGWDSSYTGEPIPAEEMREWVGGTVERLLALEHRRVLEVGCGTGLLLFRVAPHAERYRGSDLSAVALAQVRAGLGRLSLPQVELAQGAADDWGGVPPGDFELVVLNSVVQYFPSVDYLVRVLTGAVTSVAPGGAVFIGDVRSLPLLAAFHASVQIHRAAGSLAVAELAQRIRRRAAEEEELVLDPGFFLALARRLPAIRRVQVLLKRGRRTNELTRFRYDVVLHVGSTETDAAARPVPVRAETWDSTGWTLDGLERLLAERPEALAVAGIPNSRLAGEAAALELLADGGMRSVEELRAEIERRARVRETVDPEDLWALADRLGYEADLTWSMAGGLDGRFDAVLRRRGVEVPAGVAVAPAAGEEPPWSVYANDPLRPDQERHLPLELRRFLAAELPEHMVPSACVLLEALPLNVNGKVDRAALPAPERTAEPSGQWVAPATPLEELLARVTAEVLGREGVGMRDNFFDLGGHSLLATQLVSRLTQGHGIQVTLQMVFDAEDLGALADRIVELELASADAGLLDEALQEMEGLSPEELRALLEQTGMEEDGR